MFLGADTLIPAGGADFNMLNPDPAIASALMYRLVWP
jgi:hypothetical protein